MWSPLRSRKNLSTLAALGALPQSQPGPAPLPERMPLWALWRQCLVLPLSLHHLCLLPKQYSLITPVSESNKWNLAVCILPWLPLAQCHTGEIYRCVCPLFIVIVEQAPTFGILFTPLTFGLSSLTFSSSEEKIDVSFITYPRINIFRFSSAHPSERMRGAPIA